MLKRKWVTASVALMLTASLAACSGGNNEPAATNSGEKAPSESNGKKEEVSFWYLWGGTEGENVEKLISEFNASQDKYEVKGLSVPDVQKIIVAISSGDGPDITDNFSNNTASYVEKGMLLSLDEYIARDKYDVSDFVPAALEAGRYNGELYALPINVNFNMMFYNKTLLAKAGLDTPPSTEEELLDYAIKLTETNADGSIKVLGFPDFPTVYYGNNMTYALGGNFISEDGKTLTPDNEGMKKAIELLRAYREKFGSDNVLKFNSSAKYLDATDPFIMGNQAIRFDGPWFGNTVKNVLKKDLDYGIAPLPAPAGKPELAGGGEVSASTFFIPSNAKSKDGAWAFMSWLMSKENMVKFNDMFANLPARTSVYDDPAFQDIPDFKAFADAAKNPNLKSFPTFGEQATYSKAIADEFELAINFKKSADEAMAEMKKKSASLLK
ncbi:ABC transporter substrate-binding protein [Paenibacillus sp. strain BS8-2]